MDRRKRYELTERGKRKPQPLDVAVCGLGNKMLLISCLFSTLIVAHNSYYVNYDPRGSIPLQRKPQGGLWEFCSLGAYGIYPLVYIYFSYIFRKGGRHGFDSI